ncbi:MAG: pyruvate kinase [Bacteroidia bacterium]|nr:pyruvate kinase [Bacteroidia bacterium]
MQRKVKIICTIGPASRSEERIRELLDAGMDVARLNFSHGSREEHLEMIERLRAVAEQHGTPLAILQDLQGPKIRTGPMPEGGVQLIDGSDFTIAMDFDGIGNAQRCGTTYPQLAEDVLAGQHMLLDDGYLTLEILDVTATEIRTRVVKGGVLKSNKGIIVPKASISAPALSRKDLEDLDFGLRAGVDAVALSFVRSERDVIELQSAMKYHGRNVPVIAKIERWEGFMDIEDIIREADGIMVARGDLGLEMPAEQVPVLQKHIIRRCNAHGKPVITATQMLESMITQPRPTRAEASDVANAVLDGTDCVMLSGETSVGDWPVASVTYMDRIIRAIEASEEKHEREYAIPDDERHNVTDAIGKAACGLAQQIGAAAIVTLTRSGDTARLIAKYRPSTPILALSDTAATLRGLAFTWGVKGEFLPPLPDQEYSIEAVRKLLLERGLVDAGALVVFSIGSPLHKRGPTNMLEVRKV